MKGCQRKIVYLKNTKSAYFDEAYFIMKPNAENSGEESILREAERILGKAEPDKYKPQQQYRGGSVINFFIGALSGATVAFTISLLFF